MFYNACVHLVMLYFRQSIADYWERIDKHMLKPYVSTTPTTQYFDSDYNYNKYVKTQLS